MEVRKRRNRLDSKAMKIIHFQIYGAILKEGLTNDATLLKINGDLKVKLTLVE